MLRDLDPNKYDIALLQEPVINTVNLTTTNSRWNTIYPTCHNNDHTTRTRTTILVNKSLLKDNWRIIPMDTLDVTAIELKGNMGKIQIYNIYNDSSHDITLNTLNQHFASKSTKENESLTDGILLMGDFNHHCYNCFFSLYFFSLTHVSLVLLSPRTSISTDWFSRTDYIVPPTHRFPSHSLLFYDDASLS